MNRTLAILIVAFVVLLGGASVTYNLLSDKVDTNQLATNEGGAVDSSEATRKEGGSEENDTANGEEPKRLYAPEFTVYDKDGNAVLLSSYIGKPIVLNFWASWCGPCQLEMPDFQEEYKKQGEEVHFLMINVTDGSRETVESASEFIEKKGYEFPVFYDTEYSASAAYSATSLPMTYFINADGYVIAQAKGAIDAETLQKGIGMIMK